MFARTYRKADQQRRFLIVYQGPVGWEVRDEQDDAVVRQVQYTDWQRVERARMAFDEEGRRLTDAGWTEL